MLSNIQAQIEKGNHIGLVGPNGVGKTTLLRLITGSLDPSGGHVARFPALKIGYLPQHPDYPDVQTVFSEVFTGLGEVRLIEQQMRDCEATLKQAEDEGTDALQRWAQHYADLSERFELLGGSNAEGHVEEMLDGLGVPHRLWQSKMESLSGGERNVVGLARILIGNHDLFLLDEPGNHLDFSGLEWLERMLVSSEKAFIIVSHNRYLLDKVCNQVWELSRQELTAYTGNYSHYRQEKLSAQLRQEMDFKRAQKDINRLQFNIQRLKSWASVYDNPALAKTAKVFEKRVEKLQQVDKPTGDGKKMRFRFLIQPPKGNIALDVKGYRKQFEGHPPLLEDVSFLISKGERVALVGNNGTGKSSILKDIIDEGRWENEVLRVGKSVQVGYFAQLGENLDPKSSLVENAMKMTGMLRGNATDLLHRFLFTRDDLEKNVSVLSGGEKARLQLAALVSSGADMLLLDEPTNHLDIPSREAVEDALEEFPGTLLFVSHDRYFLDKLSDQVVHFEPPNVITYDGNFSEFWSKRKRHTSVDKPLGHSPMDEQKSVKTKQPIKSKQKRFKFDPQRFKELDEEIHRLEDIRPEIEREYHLFIEKGKLARAEHRRKRLSQINSKLELLYEEWLELGEKKKKWS